MMVSAEWQVLRSAFSLHFSRPMTACDGQGQLHSRDEGVGGGRKCRVHRKRAPHPTDPFIRNQRNSLAKNATFEISSRKAIFYVVLFKIL
jgi:hypothetical protein